MRRLGLMAVVAAGVGLQAAAAAAQEATLDVKLIAAEPISGQCSVVFNVDNKLGADIKDAQFEIYVWNTKNSYAGIFNLRLAPVPAGKTRGTKFTLPKPAPGCDQIGRLQWNGFTSCKSDKDIIEICNKGLRLSSIVDKIDFSDTAQ